MATALRWLLPLIALVIGLLALGHSALAYEESVRIERDGVDAPVTAISNTKRVKQSGNHITFRADVTYARADGRSVTSSTVISTTKLDAFEAGTPVYVRYLRDRPESIRISGEEYEGSSWLLVIIGCVAVAYGIVGPFLASRRKTALSGAKPSSASTRSGNRRRAR